MAASTNPKSTTDTSTFTIFEADTPWGSAASLDGRPIRKAMLATSGNSYTVVVSYKFNYSDTAHTRSTQAAADSPGVPIIAPKGYAITKITITAASATAGTATLSHCEEYMG